jgi:acyl transferase domain-containing protein/acyl carrier protein
VSDPATTDQLNGMEIAVIGLTGRFPGANSIDAFWRNLQQGVESIRFFTDAELRDAGIATETLDDPQYVKAAPTLDDIDLFDAAFFGYNPKEAEAMDPQQRIFLECAWEALEQAGYATDAYSGAIGVYAGMSMSSYMLNLFSNRRFMGSLDKSQFLVALGNDKDFLATRASYKLGLEGPSFVVQTACSTSLVALHLACQGLLSGECDIALAGGVSVKVPQTAGYFYAEGSIFSPDGHCRTFDAQAQGTLFGSGIGIVALKRLEDALADGDTIHAVIKGSAINNDGSLKVGYTAPSIDGQARVIRAAQAVAEVDPETITLIEAHGTGTALGDPIEIAALTQVFREKTQRREFCAIGSVKTNIGHLDTAAGVAGLIKAILALKHAQIPPSLHFERPNPQIDFAHSPFYVNTRLSAWETNGTPRRAGVSSFGIGGTNAHVILEAAPQAEPSDAERPWRLLTFSAKTSAALDKMTANLAAYFRQHPDLNPADAAHTLQVGRRTFERRRMLVCRDLDDAINVLESGDPARLLNGAHEPQERSVVFLFPGQGAQYPNMARELYECEPAFREQVDTCCTALEPHLGLDLRHILFPSAQQTEAAAEQLNQTAITQPALFVIEYALARLWMAWGVRPRAMIGHSIGEYVAACLAGVLTLEDALALVSARGRLMQSVPSGAMLSVALPEEAVCPLLGPDLALAAVNAPSLCVVAGPTEAIVALERQLTGSGIECRRLHTSHAFHSPMMEPILQSFAAYVARVRLSPPHIPYLSNVSGDWITPAEATDPHYWVTHLRQTVRFSQGLRTLLTEPDQVLLEVGPGRTLSTFARQHAEPSAKRIVLTSLRHPQDQQSDVAFTLHTLGRLWLSGVVIDWAGVYARQRRYRIPLPTYPFDRQRYWVERQQHDLAAEPAPVTTGKRQQVAEWLYAPVWKPTSAPNEFAQSAARCLVFRDPCGIGDALALQLQRAGQDVITVAVADQFRQTGERAYAINPQRPEEYDALIAALGASGQVPQTIIHGWSLLPDTRSVSNIERFGDAQRHGFFSLLFLVQALDRQRLNDPIQVGVLSNKLHDLSGAEIVAPEQAPLLGACKVIPQEYANITCRAIDLAPLPDNAWQAEYLAEAILAELANPSPNTVIAYRGRQRWVQTFEALRPERAALDRAVLRERGVYLIVDGLEGAGFVFARYLAQTVRARLVLIERTAFPERVAWEHYVTALDEHDWVRRKIENAQALERLGADVYTLGVDRENAGQLTRVVDKLIKQLGALHGVFYTPTYNEPTIRAVREINAADCADLLRARMADLVALEQALNGKALDFCLLQSSLSSILGGLGTVAHSAADCFTDAFAREHNRTHPVRWISVNWDRLHTDEAPQDAPTGAGLAEFAITSDEAQAVLRHILALPPVSQVVVSTGDLIARITQWINGVDAQRATHGSDAAPGALHQRPELPNAYVAPRNELEQGIAEVWQELLGIGQVGVYDNFFELGGHSLLATQIVSRLREVLPIDIPLRRMFDAQTVADLAVMIVQGLAAQEDDAEMAQMLAEIEQLSLEEVSQ